MNYSFFKKKSELQKIIDTINKNNLKVYYSSSFYYSIDDIHLKKACLTPYFRHKEMEININTKKNLIINNEITTIELCKKIILNKETSSIEKLFYLKKFDKVISISKAHSYNKVIYITPVDINKLAINDFNDSNNYLILIKNDLIHYNNGKFYFNNRLISPIEAYIAQGISFMKIIK